MYTEKTTEELIEEERRRLALIFLISKNDLSNVSRRMIEGDDVGLLAKESYASEFIKEFLRRYIIRSFPSEFFTTHESVVVAWKSANITVVISNSQHIIILHRAKEIFSKQYESGLSFIYDVECVINKVIE